MLYCVVMRFVCVCVVVLCFVREVFPVYSLSCFMAELTPKLCVLLCSVVLWAWSVARVLSGLLYGRTKLRVASQ